MRSQLQAGQRALGCPRSGIINLGHQQYRAFVKPGRPVVAASASPGHCATITTGLHTMDTITDGMLIVRS